MSDNATGNPDTSGSDAPGSESPRPASSKMGAKLAILAIIVLGMATFAYDTLVAKPSVQSAYYEITDESLRLSNAGEDGTLSNTDVHRILGKTPIETFEDGDRTVEVFGFMGGMLVNKHKLYVMYESVDGNLAFRTGRVLQYETKDYKVVEVDPNADEQDAADPMSGGPPAGAAPEDAPGDSEAAEEE